MRVDRHKRPHTPTRKPEKHTHAIEERNKTKKKYFKDYWKRFYNVEGWNKKIIILLFSMSSAYKIATSLSDLSLPLSAQTLSLRALLTIFVALPTIVS